MVLFRRLVTALLNDLADNSTLAKLLLLTAGQFIEVNFRRTIVLLLVHLVRFGRCLTVDVRRSAFGILRNVGIDVLNDGIEVPFLHGSDDYYYSWCSSFKMARNS
jgi:hypothetical protein